MCACAGVFQSIISPSLRGEVASALHMSWLQKVTFFQGAEIHQVRVRERSARLGLIESCSHPGMAREP